MLKAIILVYTSSIVGTIHRSIASAIRSTNQSFDLA